MLREQIWLQNLWWKPLLKLPPTKNVSIIICDTFPEYYVASWHQHQHQRSLSLSAFLVYTGSRWGVSWWRWRVLDLLLLAFKADFISPRLSKWYSVGMQSEMQPLMHETSTEVANIQKLLWPDIRLECASHISSWRMSLGQELGVSSEQDLHHSWALSDSGKKSRDHRGWQGKSSCCIYPTLTVLREGSRVICAPSMVVQCWFCL